ncbi:hypothetical protein [Streptomyces radicis]|uniref:hypothetical protein n=1 Tax=Streptomyces radicis TaxID=1750517 RepID=UPI001E455AFD|nr:hypothetical protein [Streptomyces radicis]
MDSSEWQIQKKGDEVLALAPLDGSASRLVDNYIRHLVFELAQFNEIRVAHARMRLRAAIHQGLAEHADNGFAGRTVVETCRLLNSTVAHVALKAADDANLALLLSDRVYNEWILGGHTTLVPAVFREVAVEEKEYAASAWLWVPGGSAHRLDLGPGPASPPAPGRGAAHGAEPQGRTTVHGEQVSVTSFNAPVDLRGGVIGFGGGHG